MSFPSLNKKRLRLQSQDGSSNVLGITTPTITATNDITLPDPATATTAGQGIIVTTVAPNPVLGFGTPSIAAGTWHVFVYNTPASSIPASAFIGNGGLILSDASSPYTLPTASALFTAVTAAYPALTANSTASFVLKLAGGGNDSITLNAGTGGTLINNDNQTFTKPGILQIIITSSTTYDFLVVTDNQP